ncbi:MAG: hypothetical protein KIS92_09885 [Planctomycetota bacterium]|nr:hypothetical protein [Planctomycetota bacterium]
MTNSAEELDVMIEEYLDGRLDDRRRSILEDRMKTDADVRKRVETATHSIQIIRKALVTLNPSADFEDKVSSQIISITQSNQSIRPAMSRASGGKLTAKDPDAKLIHDPEARKEQQRLMVLAGAAAVIFAIAVALIVMSVIGHQEPQAPPKPPAVDTPR